MNCVCVYYSVMLTWDMCLMTDQSQQVNGSVSTVWPSHLNPEEATNRTSLRKTDKLLKTYLPFVLRKKLKNQN